MYLIASAAIPTIPERFQRNPDPPRMVGRLDQRTPSLSRLSKGNCKAKQAIAANVYSPNRNAFIFSSLFSFIYESVPNYFYLHVHDFALSCLCNNCFYDYVVLGRHHEHAPN